MAKSSSTNGASSDNGAMPLFYTKPVPLDSRAHKDWKLLPDFGVEFTAGVNAVPINLVEFPQVCHFYPIAFAPDPTGTPVALVGLRDDENLFVDDKGNWADNAYIPAYVRRYPFIFSEIPGTDQLTLCVDQADNVIDDGSGKSKKDGQRFFDDEGAPTALSQNALEFCKSYHAAAQQTLEFGKELHEAGLLIERSAEITANDGQKISFSGFRIIDENKLNEMSDKDFLEWRKKGYLPFIYAHLFSGAQWQRLTRLLNAKIDAKS